MPLMARGFMEGVKRGKARWRVKGLRWHLDARSSGVRGGRRRRDKAATQLAQVAWGGKG
jgi:hypothetical protein